MSWRSVQLGHELCLQDKLILDLFKDNTVKYVGPDPEFKRRLSHSDLSTNLVLVLNYPMWISEIFFLCRTHLTTAIDTFYIGINRYHILGNDTDQVFERDQTRSLDLIKLLTYTAEKQGFVVTKSGDYDQDLGRHFNFVQPLTWVYGHKITH